jgi:hypothetical protein
MQTKSNRPLQEGYTSAQPSRVNVLAEARERVKDAMLIYPNTPNLALATILSTDASDFTKEILAEEFYMREIRARRRKKSAEDRAQYLLPGFEHLPLKIGPDALLDLNYTGVRKYYRSLVVTAEAKIQNAPKIKEAKALMEKMRKHPRRNKGITVREVVLLVR